MGGVALYANPVCWYVVVLFDPRALFGVACPRLAARTGNRPLTAGIWLGASRAWVEMSPESRRSKGRNAGDRSLPFSLSVLWGVCDGSVGVSVG